LKLILSVLIIFTFNAFAKNRVTLSLNGGAGHIQGNAYHIDKEKACENAKTEAIKKLQAYSNFLPPELSAISILSIGSCNTYKSKLPNDNDYYSEVDTYITIDKDAVTLEVKCQPYQNPGRASFDIGVYLIANNFKLIRYTMNYKQVPRGLDSIDQEVCEKALLALQE
jgi:hypothetical protein